MCDTIVALGNATKDGSVIFAKNSDRQPNEPHIIIRVPRQKHKKDEKLKCTYIEVDQAEETYEVLLLKPSWIWGAEMGSNEYGLTIGNEAVFTKESYGDPSLIGMDMLRIALERCRTSEEALNMIIKLLETYGQGGNCGYLKKFTYHNSFLIADRTSAWVLETAGKYWAAERVKDVRSISNCLSIGSSIDRHHPELIKHALEKGWCKNEKEFHFAKCYTSPLYTKFSKAAERSCTANSILEERKGNITVKTMKEILRSHAKGVEGKQFNKHSLDSICMHGGFLYGDHTTGSFIAQLNKDLDTYYVTGSSTPCISIFKPFWFIDDECLTFLEREVDQAVDYWKLRERLHRMVIENRIDDLENFLNIRDDIEGEIDNQINELALSIDQNKLRAIMEEACEKEANIINTTLQKFGNYPSKIQGTLFFRRYWRKQSTDLFNS